MGLGALGIATVAARVLGLRASLRRGAAADEKRTIRVGSLGRNYLLHVPEDLPAGKPAPLVLVFHGGGGHTWPGGPQYLPTLVVGKASQNLNGTHTIWEFFQTQVLP
jgi:poly(3-hydroxybutyrate) depolymerase